MATTKLYLDTRGKARDGKKPVIILLYHNASTTSFNTGIRLSENEWNGTQVVRNANAAFLNSQLFEKKGKIDRAIGHLSFENDFSSLKASELKTLISEGKPLKSQTHPISSVFYDYVESKTLKPSTKNIYQLTLKKVLDFSNTDMPIEKMDYKWLLKFDKELSKSQSVNGRGIYMRSLRSVYNHAQKTGIACPYPFDNFKIRQEETIKRSVSLQELRAFYNYPATEKQAYYRDYFFLMFFLIGINSKDLLLAKKSQVMAGRLEYNREKTGKKYSVKIEPEAEYLIKKYSGDRFLLEAMDRFSNHKDFLKKLNANIKQIGPVIEKEAMQENLFAEPEMIREVHPVIPGISSYYARHTWATLAYEIGVPMDVISQALGHSMGNRTTLIYVKLDQSKVDQANRRIIDYFFNG